MKTYNKFGGVTMESLQMIRNKNAVDFLLFSYFSFSLNNLKKANTNDVIAKIIERAYKDATQQGAFNTSLKTDEDKENANKAHEDGAEAIQRALENAINNQYKDVYDSWHAELCQKLVKLYLEKGLSSFTYGNAQKWVNMTMKYIMIVLDITSLFGSEYNEAQFIKTHGDLIGKYREYLHVPVDSYIIKSVWEDKTIKLPIIKTLKSGKRGNYSSEKVIAWSKWNNDKEDKTYDDFQASLRKKYESPIDWEGPAWIEQAKSEKNK